MPFRAAPEELRPVSGDCADGGAHAGVLGGTRAIAVQLGGAHLRVQGGHRSGRAVQAVLRVRKSRRLGSVGAGAEGEVENPFESGSGMVATYKAVEVDGAQGN